MHSLLNQNSFFLKQQTGLLSATQRFDVYDPKTKEQLMKREEAGFGGLKSFLRMIGYTNSIPFHITVSDMAGNRLFSVKRKFSFFNAKVLVYDENENVVGKIKKSGWFSSFSSDYTITNPTGEKLCSFLKTAARFWKGNKEFATLNGNMSNHDAHLIDITDQYELIFNKITSPDDPLRVLVFAAIMSIDLIVTLKAKKKVFDGKFKIDI